MKKKEEKRKRKRKEIASGEGARTSCRCSCTVWMFLFILIGCFCCTKADRPFGPPNNASAPTPWGAMDAVASVSAPLSCMDRYSLNLVTLMTLLVRVWRWEEWSVFLSREHVPLKNPKKGRKVGKSRRPCARRGWRLRHRARIGIARAPRLPLNKLMRGGGGNTAQAKRQEQALLGVLSEVLARFSKDRPTPAEHTQHAGSDVDSLLIGALQRLLERAHKNPVGLLDRLSNLVKVAREGRLEAPGPKKSNHARPNPTSKGVGKSETVGPKGPSRTFAQVAGEAKGKGKGKSKGGSASHASAPSLPLGAKKVELERSCWGGRLTEWSVVVDALEKGQAPPGQATYAPSKDKAEEARALAAAHGLKLEFACCVMDFGAVESSSPFVAVSLPCRCDGKLEFRKFGLLPLGEKLPMHPGSLVKTLDSKDLPAKKELVALRLFVPKCYVSDDKWKSFKAQPKAGVDEWRGEIPVHSTYGWNENTHKNFKGDTEIFLTGYIKVEQKHLDACLKLSGRHAVFVERLAKEQACRPNVAWYDRGQKTFAEYFAWLRDESKSKSCPLAFRVGGGNNLGLRVQKLQDARTLGVWRVSGVPEEWTAEELNQVLVKADWKDIEVIAPPQKRAQPWLIRAKAPASLVGVVAAVEWSDGFLLLQRAPQRKPQDVSSTRLIQTKAPPKVVLQTVEPLVATEGEPSGEVAVTQLDAGGDVSMSPPPSTAAVKRDGSPKPTSKSKKQNAGLSPETKRGLNKDFDVLETGGQGSCGYSSLAVGAALMRGSKLEDLQGHFASMATTLRVQIAQHVATHEADYRPDFAPDLEATEGADDGEPPKTWTDWVASLSRPRRWICQLTLKAGARRLGIKLVVVQKNNDGTWGSPVVMGRSQKREHPVVLGYSEVEKHYVLLIPKEGKASIPPAWLQVQQSDAISLSQESLRGSGKRGFDAANSVGSRTPVKKNAVRSSGVPWLPDHTPSAASSSSSSFKRPRLLSSRVSADELEDSSAWLPASTPGAASPVASSKRKKKAGVVLTPTKHTVSKHWLPADTPKSVNTSVASAPGTLRMRMVGKQNVGIPCPPKPELRVWTCRMPKGSGICGFRCEGPLKGRKLSQQRTNHLANRHAGEDISQAGLIRKLVERVDASPNLPVELRSWTCGVVGCNAGLPHFEDSKAGAWARDCAIERHRLAAHPRVSRKKLHSLRWARFREGGDEQLKDSRDVLRDKLRARVDKRLADNRTAGKHNGHELCMVEMSRPCKIKKSSRIARVVTCKSCWDFGTEKSVTSKPCAGKPNGSSYTKREWWKRQMLEWPRNVKCLLAVWDVDLKKVDDVYRYSS